MAAGVMAKSTKLKLRRVTIFPPSDSQIVLRRVSLIPGQGAGASRGGRIWSALRGDSTLHLDQPFHSGPPCGRVNGGMGLTIQADENGVLVVLAAGTGRVEPGARFSVEPRGDVVILRREPSEAERFIKRPPKSSPAPSHVWINKPSTPFDHTQ